MARTSTSGSPWAIVFLGTVAAAVGVLFLVAPVFGLMLERADGGAARGAGWVGG